MGEHSAESAQEWGRRQAEAASPWSDEKWRRVSAILRINVAPAAGSDQRRPRSAES